MKGETRNLIADVVFKVVRSFPDISVQDNGEGYIQYRKDRSIETYFTASFDMSDGGRDTQDFIIESFVSGDSALFTDGAAHKSIRAFKANLDEQVKRALLDKRETDKVLRYPDSQVYGFVTEQWVYSCEFMIKRGYSLHCNTGKAYSQVVRMKEKDPGLFGELVVFLGERDSEKAYEFLKDRYRKKVA